jgi:hypothetical protein
MFGNGGLWNASPAVKNKVDICVCVVFVVVMFTIMAFCGSILGGPACFLVSNLGDYFGGSRQTRPCFLP